MEDGLNKTPQNPGGNGNADKAPDSPDSPKRPSRLTYVLGGGKGPSFFKPDGTRYEASSPEEKDALDRAVAHNMVTNEQTPGMPELDVQPLNDQGQPAQVTTPNAAPAQPQEPQEPSEITIEGKTFKLKNFERVATPADPDKYYYHHKNDDGTILPDSDGTPTKIFVFDKAMDDRINRAKHPADAALSAPVTPATAPANGPQVQAQGPQAAPRQQQQRPQDGQQQSQGPGQAPPAQANASRPGAENIPTGKPEWPRWANRYGAKWRDGFNAAEYSNYVLKKVPEIIANPRHQQLFAELIIALDKDMAGVFEKVAEGQRLTPEENVFLSFAQHEYSKNFARCLVIEKHFNKEEIEVAMARDPNFRAMVSANGAEKTAEAFKVAIYDTAMHDKNGFEQFYFAFKNLRSNKRTERAKAAERSQKEFCDKYGIQNGHYADFVDLSSKESIQRSESNLTQQIHMRAGRFRRLLDVIDQRNPFNRTRMGEYSFPIPGSSASVAGRAIEHQVRYAPEKFQLFNPRSWATGDKGGIAANRTEILQFLRDMTARPEFVQETKDVFNKTATAERDRLSKEQVQELRDPMNSARAMRDRIRKYIGGNPNWTPEALDRLEDTEPLAHPPAPEKKEKTGWFRNWIRAMLEASRWKAAKKEAIKPAA